MSDFDDLLRVVVRMSHQLEEMKHTATNMLREGVVEKVDGKRGYQVSFGKDEDGKPIPSAWFPHHEQGGAFKTWRPSSKGQIVYVVAPGGDQRRAFVVPRGGFSDDNPQPSDKLEENVDTFGQYRREIREKDTVDKVGKAKVSKKAEGKITAETGDQPDDGSAPGGLGANVQHELNKQLQGIRANLTQLENNVAGLHEITSRFREIAQGRIAPSVEEFRAGVVTFVMEVVYRPKGHLGDLTEEPTLRLVSVAANDNGDLRFGTYKEEAA